MRRIILASHHRFAAGLRDTLEFVGAPADMIAVCAYIDDEPLDVQLDHIFSNFDADDSILIMTDMLQGSVNQAFQKYLGPRVFIVTGINVPCALELTIGKDPFTEEMIRSAIDRARSQLIFVNDYVAEVSEDDE